LNEAKHLLDVNILVALLDEEHVHHDRVTKWFDSEGYRSWAVCAFTEAGFLRVMTKSKAGPRPIEAAIALLARIASHPGYRFWSMTDSWASLAGPFATRIFGHQQVTDAYLLGLAVKEAGVLVTLDRGMSYLAGTQYSRNLLVLE
jgi:uncharacterized protein